MRHGLTIFAGLLIAGVASADEVRLARHPHYHEGQLVFSYLGDLWLARDGDPRPRRLTVHPARDIAPRFSPDGRWIAFSSARHGNFDVFVMPAAGGAPRRLTFHGANDTVVGWSPDSRKIVFTSARGRVYPGTPNLLEVARDGGLEQPLPTDWGSHGSYSPDGSEFAFNRHPMPWFRKHYRGSYAADLWTVNLATRQFRHRLDPDLPDERKPNNFWPMYGRDAIYFVSDRATEAKSGTPEVMASVNNIWKLPLDGGSPVQVTRHTSGSLFFPAMSADGGTIVYEENAGLWKLDLKSGESTEYKFHIASDDRDNPTEQVTVNSEADDFSLSPSGKRAVVTTHGELITIATDKGDPKRLTHTGGVREVSPRWSPDGKWIAFVSDQTGREEIWLCDEAGGQMKAITDLDALKTDLTWSPDGSALAFVAGDNKLRKYTLAGGQTTELGHSPTGFLDPQWSPDGRWLAYTRTDPANQLPHVYVIPSAGGPERRITADPVHADYAARWTPDGKKIVYLAGGDIRGQGRGGRGTSQIYLAALTPDGLDPEKGVDSEAQAAAKPDAKPNGEPGKVGEVKIEFDTLSRRVKQLTRVPDSISDMAVTPDSKAVAFVTFGTEGGRPTASVWLMPFDDERPLRLASSAGGDSLFSGGYSSPQFAKDGRTVFVRRGKSIEAISVPPSGPSPAQAASPAAPRKVAFTVQVEIDHAARRRQVFAEAWRTLKYRFYDETMHGVDWDKARQTYEPLLAHVADQEELHNLINQMMGELNASHLGISGGGPGERTGPAPRYPGFELEADASGLYKVVHVYRNGPADTDRVKIRPGDFIIAIDGRPLKSGDNYWKHYSESPGPRIEFLVNDKPEPAGAWSAKVSPIGSEQYGTLQYEQWVEERRRKVDQLSGGTIGYLHIRQMNEPALRQFERDLAAQRGKAALILDQRFNPGGNIDQELLEILQQKQYQVTKPRGGVEVPRPQFGFFGPMAVLQNQRSTSDAEVFPDGFKTLGLGPVIGVTTYGAVIGTGGHTLMDGSTVRTPGFGLWNLKGTNLENNGVPPDIYVDNTPSDFLQGRDAQLEKAVEVLKAKLKK